MTEDKLHTLREQIANETDHDRLTALIREMEQLLEQEQAEIKAKIADNLKTV